MTGGKTEERILPAWPACSHSESLMLRCDILWKPWTCADSSCSCHSWSLLFCCSRATQSVKTFLDIKAVSVHSGRRELLMETCHRPLADRVKSERSGVAVLCQAAASPLGPTRRYLLCPYAPTAPVYQPKHLIMSFWTNWSQNHLTLRMNPQVSASSAGTQRQPGFGSVFSRKWQFPKYILTCVFPPFCCALYKKCTAL